MIYTGGGVINAGPAASAALTQFVRMTGFPVTNTLMGLGAYPASDPQFLGMLGMHGTYEANLAMHGCDVLLNIGARFDDRVTGRLNAFSPGSQEDPRRHRSVIDQQERAGRRRRSSAMPAVCSQALVAAWKADTAVPDTAGARPPGGGRSTPGAPRTA